MAEHAVSPATLRPRHHHGRLNADRCLANRFVNVYDDAGGTYDHMVPPFEGVPDDESPCQAPCRSFDFRRLGLRTTGMIMSPWIKKAHVIQEPQPPYGIPGRSPYNTSQFELTSVAASVKHLFNVK